MDTFINKIVPITKARAQLSRLTSALGQNDYVVLTKGGQPTAALVDITYLTKLQTAVRKLYQKTYLDPKLIPFTRMFTDSELDQWAQEDRL